MAKKVVVIGSGFAGLSAAACLAKQGHDVELLEKNAQAGGRARQFSQDGFTFDMGPSWYWMPDVFESYFQLFGQQVSDHYQLKRLDPSYAVFFGKNDVMHLPPSREGLRELFESIEPGSADKLDKFLAEAAYKYDVGIKELVFKPGRSLMEFADMRLLKGMMQLHVFQPFSKYVRKYFRDPRLIQLMEFPVLFLGAMPQKIPALYSLMNYADMHLGTWYPMGGMNRIVQAMVKVAEQQGVKIRLDEGVEKMVVKNQKVSGLITSQGEVSADVVVGGADYHHIEQNLLPEKFRRYNNNYWDKRVMAPSSLIFYLGVNKKLNSLEHHNLFFDEPFLPHAREIYEDPKWPTKPLFYVSCTSKTDPDVAPEGQENLFILIPVAPGLEDHQTTREHYYELVMDRLEKITGQTIREHVTFKRSYAHHDFITDYNAFKGNAYGLANTLRQTALLKPKLKSRLDNLYYTGQLTVPGPGVPPAIISGQVVASQISKDFK